MQNVSGNNTWQATVGPLSALTLGGNVTIGVSRAQDTLAIKTPITESPANSGYGVTEIGPGTLDYQGTNTYTGLTQVTQGALLLDDNSGSAPERELDRQRRCHRPME